MEKGFDMKYFITGSSGFIGSHLVAELRKQGHEVIECSRRIGKDLRRIIADELKGVDVLVHLGAASGSLYFDPEKIYNGYSMEDSVDVNCRGTLHLLEMCRRAGVKRFIFASTASRYAGTKCPHKESCKPICSNIYTATKMFGEDVCKLYKEIYGMDVTVLRFASVYGDGERQKGLLANIVSQFIWKLMDRQQPELWGDGTQTRDFIFVDDVVDACIFTAEKKKIGFGPFNVGTGVESSFNDVVGKINEVLGNANEDYIPPKYTSSSNASIQKRFIDRQLMDVSKMRRLGWVSKISLDQGIRKIIGMEEKRA